MFKLTFWNLFKKVKHNEPSNVEGFKEDNENSKSEFKSVSSAEYNLLQESNRNLLEKVESQQETISKQSVAQGKLREIIAKNRLDIEDSRFMKPLTRQLLFSKAVIEDANALKSDAYISHEVMPLLATKVLANLTGGKKFCNVVEIPSFKHRAIDVSWDATTIEAIDSMVSGLLKDCDEFLTIGDSLGRELAHYGPNINVIPNYKYREVYTKSNELRDLCGLKDNDKLVLAMSTIASGFEEVIDALTLLPDNVHLVTLGQFVPKTYRTKIEKYAEEKGVLQKLHSLQEVPYNQLSSFISSADVGLIVRDINIKNNLISLPNRVFDYLNASVPIVSPNIPDIAKIVKHYDVGAIVHGGAQSWKDNILNCLTRGEELKINSLNASQELCWERLEPQITELFSSVESVTFLGLGRLAKNQRTIRIAKTLINAGKTVKICCIGNEQDILFNHSSIEYRFVNLN